MIFLTSAGFPNNACANHDSAINIKKHERNLHSFICLCVSKPIVFENTSNVHEGVRNLAKKHAHYDVIG